MKNRILRLALVVLAVAGQAAAGFFVFQSEQRHAAARDAQVALARDTGRLVAQVGELRTAQVGVVAHGQDQAFWVPKIAALTQDVIAGVKKIDRGTLGADAAQDVNAGAEALSAFARTSDRIRDLLATDQPLTASSVVFGDAAQHLTAAAGALASVAASQAAVVEHDVAVLRQRELFAIGGAFGLTLIVLLLLLPRVRPADAASEGEPGASGLGLSLNTPSNLESTARGSFDIDMARVAQNGGAIPESPHESEEELLRRAQNGSALRLNTDTVVDLPEAARLCGDLAKVKESGELPGMLARAADLLDAAGIVVWMADEGGTVLRPAASHGYSDHTMAKMKSLPARAENAVAVAYSSGRLEVVRGSKDRNGAVVAPITSSIGCVGAMAAEIRHGGESSVAVQSVAAIIAAQLASLTAETSAA